MMTMTVTPADTYSDTVATFANYIMRASVSQIEAAAVWYHDAHGFALDIADIMSIPVENAASIISAFSPRQSWALNIRNAYAFARGEDVRCLTNNLTMAANAVEFGFDALKGQKTNAFARAIAGDVTAVVIDVWMCRAANLGTDSPNKTQYAMLADAVRDAADLFGLSPRTAQALIWIIVRGGAE
jgi:hypothetical protein